MTYKTRSYLLLRLLLTAWWPLASKGPADMWLDSDGKDYSRHGLEIGTQNYRGQAYQLCIDRTRRRKPKRFILENVPALATNMQGKLLKQLEKNLREVGYKVYDCMLNALHFRVPQNRKRLFIVGVQANLYSGGDCSTGTTDCRR